MTTPVNYFCVLEKKSQDEAVLTDYIFGLKRSAISQISAVENFLGLFKDSRKQ
jgi:hypothetical protein